MAGGTTERTLRWREKKRKAELERLMRRRRLTEKAAAAKPLPRRLAKSAASEKAVRKRPSGADPPDPTPAQAGAATQSGGSHGSAWGDCGLLPGRLRSFQLWLRRRAPPAWRRVHLAAEMERSRRILRLPGLAGSRMWLVALVSFWWLDAVSRETVVPELALQSEPEWDYVRFCLTLAGEVARDNPPRRVDGPTGLGRRGPGAVGKEDLDPGNRDGGERGGRRVERTWRTLQAWHEGIVGGKAEAVSALADRFDSRDAVSSSEAARALRTLPGCGPYLAKNVINTLLLMGLVRFDVGVLGPGAIRSLEFLRGSPLQSPGLWPDQPDPKGWRRVVQQLAEQEADCHWVDIQSALCYWAPWRRGSQRAAVMAWPVAPEAVRAPYVPPELPDDLDALSLAVCQRVRRSPHLAPWFTTCVALAAAAASTEAPAPAQPGADPDHDEVNKRILAAAARACADLLGQEPSLARLPAQSDAA